MQQSSWFTEDDVRTMDEFIKYVGKNFRQEMDTATAFKWVKYITHANSMLRKMSDHIGQLEKLVEPEQQKPTRSSKKK